MLIRGGIATNGDIASLQLALTMFAIKLQKAAAAGIEYLFSNTDGPPLLDHL
jgi:hypothetical protein